MKGKGMAPLEPKLGVQIAGMVFQTRSDRIILVIMSVYKQKYQETINSTISGI